MIELAPRVSDIAESITLAVTAKARTLKAAGVDVVGFGAGEPDFDTPAFIKDEAKAALDRGETKYMPTGGTPQLKAAIAKKFQAENGLPYTDKQVTTAAGGKMCLYLAFQAVLSPGDEVIVPAPYWVSYPEQVKLAGGVPKVLHADEAAGFKLTPQQLDAAIGPKTKVVLINSPSNPSGVAYTPDELAALAAVILKHDHVAIFSDEIYEKLLYDGLKFVSVATLDERLLDRTLTFNCHSKSFAMTGWRVGYVGGPAHVIAAIEKLHTQTASHITSFTQSAAALALNDPRGLESVKAMHEQFAIRRDRMHAGLTKLPGVTCVKPSGAFYCFPNVSATFARLGVKDAVAFSSQLLEKAHVAVVPGNDSGFDTHVRLSFATSVEQIDKGLERIATFLKCDQER